MSEGIANRREVSEEWIRTPFPFLMLPPEIRNEIYRLVLLTQNVVTDKPNPDHQSLGADGDGSVQPSEVPVGTIRCNSWRTYTMAYQIAILLTNRQIYHEAWGIFQLENVWTIMRFNKAGIAKEMKDHEFPVASADDLWHHIGFPVMKVTIMFPSLKDRNQSDTLVVATVHLTQLMRALWTAKGASEMEVTIHVQPRRTKNSPDERDLVQPFFALRSIKRLDVLGMSEQRHVDDLTRAITTTDGIHQTASELAAGIKQARRDIQAERWKPAFAQAEQNLNLRADCRIVYGNRYSGVDPGISRSTAIARNQVAKEIAIGTTIIGAELALHKGNYTSTIGFANLTLNLISRTSVFRRPLLTGILTSRNETMCNMALLRARGHMGLQQAEPAFGDIEAAGKLMPHSAKVASVSLDWQVMFGASSGSACPPRVVLEG